MSFFDPVALARETEKQVARDDRRKYYRFRGARFYGGIATADCVGCCLRCVYCWGWNRASNPGGAGKFYSPEQVARKVDAIARKHGFSRVRLSGNEPTLARNHLLEVLRRLPLDLEFILETNGILLGHDVSYARALEEFSNLHVRVSLKACTAEEFSRLTGAVSEAFELPLRALGSLLEAGVSCHPSVMISFSKRRSVESMRERLHAIDPSLSDFEAEELFVNPSIEKRLERLV